MVEKRRKFLSSLIEKKSLEEFEVYKLEGLMIELSK